MMDEFKEKLEENSKLQEERQSLSSQVEHFAELVKAEGASKSAAEERMATLEKEKAVLELDVKELRKQMITSTETAEGRESELKRNLDLHSKESRELADKLRCINEELETLRANDCTKRELEQLQKQLSQEKMLKEQAVNKLAEIMNRKEMNLNGKNAKSNSKNSTAAADLRKKEKENRKLQQELINAQAQHKVELAQLAKEINDLQATLNEETLTKNRLQMEITAKDDELEQLRGKLLVRGSNENLPIYPSSSSIQSSGSGGGGNGGNGGNGNGPAADTMSLVSMSLTSSPSIGPGDHPGLLVDQHRLEGWLSIPNKQNIRRHGWRKQYVVLASRKIIFYNSEQDKNRLDPTLILDLRWGRLILYL